MRLDFCHFFDRSSSIRLNPVPDGSMGVETPTSLKL